MKPCLEYSVVTCFNTLIQFFYSPYCQQYNSYSVSSENLVFDQLIIPNLIFFVILVTYLVDIVMML